MLLRATEDVNKRTDAPLAGDCPSSRPPSVTRSGWLLPRSRLETTRRWGRSRGWGRRWSRGFARSRAGCRAGDAAGTGSDGFRASHRRIHRWVPFWIALDAHEVSVRHVDAWPVNNLVYRLLTTAPATGSSQRSRFRSICSPCVVVSRSSPNLTTVSASFRTTSSRSLW
jgi:hypothetical protein